MPTTPTAPTGGNNAVTYTRLFAEDWQAMCQPGTMEDDTGPIAYLSDLKRQVDDRHGSCRWKGNQKHYQRDGRLHHALRKV